MYRYGTVHLFSIFAKVLLGNADKVCITQLTKGDHMQLVKAYKTETVIEGLKKTVLISIEVEHEDADFSFWDDEVAKETALDLKNDKVCCLWVKVSAKFSDLAGFEGLDTLGQVFVRYSSYDKDVLQTVKDHGMSENAVKDLVAQVLQGKDSIDQFLTKAV